MLDSIFNHCCSRSLVDDTEIQMIVYQRLHRSPLITSSVMVWCRWQVRSSKSQSKGESGTVMLRMVLKPKVFSADPDAFKATLPPCALLATLSTPARTKPVMFEVD